MHGSSALCHGEGEICGSVELQDCLWRQSLAFKEVGQIGLRHLHSVQGHTNLYRRCVGLVHQKQCGLAWFGGQD